jgi:hypothetical protein
MVALKVLAASLAASGTARRRFAREARAAAAVRDDHVIAIHAVRDDAPVPYLVMEFIDGCNLAALLHKGGPLEVQEVLRIGTQVASGLAAAHRLGLVHRDVKPANILLENGVQRVKLTDFGLARTADDASLTQTGLIAGTPLYMAPEQANGQPLDCRADLFSLGSVLYELCTGRPAFRAPTTVAVIRRVCDETPRPIREVNPDVPEPLCRLIERLHAKKPANRPASAQEVANRLAGLLAELSEPRPQRSGVLGALRAAFSAVQRAWLGRRPWLWATAALVVLLAGLGMGEATGVTKVGGNVIGQFSPQGTLTEDGADGITTDAGAWEIRPNPGQYTVEAGKDGKVVRISKESGSLTETEAWEKFVAELPAEQQVEAVARRLKELNPRFDGTVKSHIAKGVVTGLDFCTDNVTNISPVRALRGLEWLECHGHYFRKGKLIDLTPLRGMALTNLKINSNPVDDLSPLQGMPLTILHCAETRVRDISPLEGMKLEVLSLQRTEVEDLAPLRGMPLRYVDLFWAQGIRDLRPLEGAPLQYLNLTALQLSDLSLIAGMKTLSILCLDSMPVTDLKPLRGLHLKDLSIQGLPVTDLTPIKELPLRKLRFNYRADLRALLRSFQGLELINEKPAAEFWKEVDDKKPELRAQL